MAKRKKRGRKAKTTSELKLRIKALEGFKAQALAGSQKQQKRIAELTRSVGEMEELMHVLNHLGEGSMRVKRVGSGLVMARVSEIMSAIIFNASGRSQ